VHGYGLSHEGRSRNRDAIYDRDVGRSLLCCWVVVLAALSLGVATCGGAAGKPSGTFDGCPTGLRVPGSGWSTAARQEAAVFLGTTYARWNRQRHRKIRLAGAQVGKPLLVRHWLPSRWVKTECGLTVWRLSVVVPVVFPAMEYPNPSGPCNACARTVWLLGKTDHGWLVWGNY
jgi:hypothetical protein